MLDKLKTGESIVVSAKRNTVITSVLFHYNEDHKTAVTMTQSRAILITEPGSNRLKTHEVYVITKTGEAPNAGYQPRAKRGRPARTRCRRCSGDGFVWVAEGKTQSCPACNGTGSIPKTEEG